MSNMPSRIYAGTFQGKNDWTRTKQDWLDENNQPVEYIRADIHDKLTKNVKGIIKTGWTWKCGDEFNLNWRGIHMKPSRKDLISWMEWYFGRPWDSLKKDGYKAIKVKVEVL